MAVLGAHITSRLPFPILGEDTTPKSNQLQILIYAAIGVSCICLMIVFVIVVRALASVRR